MLELLVVVAIIGILAAIAIPAYRSYKTDGYDAAAKADLRNAMTAIEAAIASGDPIPPSPEALASYGHTLSRGVSFTKYDASSDSVHMHTQHSQSPNAWHADYPKSSEIEQR